MLCFFSCVPCSLFVLCFLLDPEHTCCHSPRQLQHLNPARSYTMCLRLVRFSRRACFLWNTFLYSTGFCFRILWILHRWLVSFCRRPCCPVAGFRPLPTHFELACSSLLLLWMFFFCVMITGLFFFTSEFCVMACFVTFLNSTSVPESVLGS